MREKGGWSSHSPHFTLDIAKMLLLQCVVSMNPHITSKQNHILTLYILNCHKVRGGDGVGGTRATQYFYPIS